MGKSILVIDIPEKCIECPLCAFERRCQAKEEILMPSNIRGQKPDWCPLQDVPEKRDSKDYLDDDAEAYCNGWNDCLDKILNGG